MRKNIFILEQFDSINIECNFNIIDIETNMATNDIMSIVNEGKNLKKTVFINNDFFCGDNKKSPKLTLSYLNSNIKKISFVDMFTKGEYLGYRFNTKSLIDEISNNKSILYPYVFSLDDFKKFNSSLHFLFNEKINKNNYVYFTKSKLNTIKNLFNENYFNIGIGYTLRMNSFPLTLLHAVKLLNKNINIFIFTDIIVGEKYLTQDQLNILNTFDFINIIKINNNEKLNYLSMCDLLVSCCNDLTNVIDSSILIEEYKLCNKPILCSRGKERERQLGKYYPGFYTAKSCYVVPPIYWSRSYLINPSNYKELYVKYFKYNCDKREIDEIMRIINKEWLENERLDKIRKEQLEKLRKEQLEKINNINNIRNKKICINTHSNLNICGGDTIMLLNIVKLLTSNNNKVTIISKYDNNVLERNTISTYKHIKTNNILSTIKSESYNNDIILIRNPYILDGLLYKYLHKTIIYGLNEDLSNLKMLNNRFSKVLTQSEKLKKIFISNGIKEEKIIIQEPVAHNYNFNLPERKDNEIRLIYCGTLRDEENILEIIEEFQNIHKERPEVVLKIVYGKINGNNTFTEKVHKYIKNGVNGITFKYNLTHKKACYEIATSDFGICWRKNGWGDNGEISTKVKEYQLYGLKILNSNIYINKNKIKKNTINIKFGENYKIFNNINRNENINYDFTYKIVSSNTLTKIYLVKNVFYKINNSCSMRVHLYNENNKVDNIYRNCLHGKNIYFQVNKTNTYYLLLKTKNKQEICIENYISINYICGDNVYMLNLNHQKSKFIINEVILNKLLGVKVNRFEAINGYDEKYDKLWDTISNRPFTEIEKKLGRKAIISRGSMGYLLSMEKIFSNIKSNYVCIFDDDILINKNFTIEKLTKILINFSDFNILKFGSSQWSFNDIKLYDNFYNPNELSNGSFACIYKSTTYKDILKKIKNFNEPFDFSPLRQFNNNKSYVLYPNPIIANLSDISTITNKTRDKDYDRFKWNINNYIKLPYIKYKKILKYNINNKNLHFVIGITTFKRIYYLKVLINSLILTLNNEHFFTIIISKGLDLLEKEDYQLEQFLIKSFEQVNNIKLVIHYSYLHYIYNTSNAILKFCENIEFDFGFILNDDIILYSNWYMSYYKSFKKNKIDHLCWLKDINTTIVDKEKNLKHNGSILNSNGVLLTFTKDLIKNVGFFNETDFKVRGQSHIEWSLRCCNNGYNNKNNFYDIINSNKLVKLNTKYYTSAISNTKYFDKVIYFVDKYELERRNVLLNNFLNSPCSFDFVDIFNTAFDNIYGLYINEKELKLLKNLKNIHNINIDFFEGVNGKKVLNKEYKNYISLPFITDYEKRYKKKRLSIGALGHLHSFINMIKDAKKKGYRKILILEGDVFIHLNIFEEFTKAFHKIKDYKILYLGAGRWNKNIKIKKYYYLPNQTTTGTFAIAFDSSIYDELIQLWEQILNPTDICLREIHNKYPNKCYVLYPNLIICNLSESNIQDTSNRSNLYEKFNWDLNNYILN